MAGLLSLQPCRIRGGWTLVSSEESIMEAVVMIAGAAGAAMTLVYLMPRLDSYFEWE